MTESTEFVKILSEQYSIDVGYNKWLKEKIMEFWYDVERISMEKEINERELLKAQIVSDKLWSNYNGLPQFENDLDAARYFSNLVKVAMKKEPTAIELFKIERRIVALEMALHSLISKGKKAE